MKSFKIGEDACGQRLDRYLNKLMPLAGRGFLQKMLRKKNIKLNGKKADPKAMLEEGDLVEVFFSDETFDSFQKTKSEPILDLPNTLREAFEHPVYESAELLAIHKPCGILSQPNGKKDIAASQAALLYLERTDTFSPAPLNRLDRNTSGILLFPKTYQAQKKYAEILRVKTLNDSSSKKIYYALVEGRIDAPGGLDGRIVRDQISLKSSMDQSGEEVYLTYEPILFSDQASLVRIFLQTGKTHQIRTQFSAFGHPLIGDRKYGSHDKTLPHYQLHAAEYLLENEEDSITIKCPLPPSFIQALEEYFPKQNLKAFLDGKL